MPTGLRTIVLLITFSGRGRSLCPSCEKKKQLLWGQWLHEEVLLPIAHRHGLP
jgi:hypothetical protein